MLMHSASLYLSSVLIWGSTWYAIKFQLGVVAAEVSLVYRFALGISTMFEGYMWTLLAVFGFGLVLLGNYVVLTKGKLPVVRL